MASGLLDHPMAGRLLAAAAAAGLDLGAALTGSDDDLRPTQLAQPALLLVELVLSAALPAGLDVVGAAGHSVGEYAAVSVAGALAPEDAMRLVVRRGRAMAAMTEGTMAAILGLDAHAVEEACAVVREDGDVVVVANLNAPDQVVVSGTRSGVDRAGAIARERGARRVVPLNVSGAFHSPLMAPAAAGFADEVTSTPMGEMRVPVVCNVDGAVVSSSTELPDRLARQLESAVRWVDCVNGLLGLGATTLVEVGPGAVLSGLARRIAPQARTLAVHTLSDAAAVLSAAAAPA